MIKKMVERLIAIHENIFSDNIKGLSEQEARLRIRRFGENKLEKKRFKGIKIFLSQFRSPLIWILIITAIISSFLGELASASIILVMTFFSTLLSFFDEYRSERIVENLNKKIAHKAIVLRDNVKKEIHTYQIVPGDIVFLNIGSVVPADAKVISSKNLSADESTLTGESMPVSKREKDDLFAGTVVASGEAECIIVATGKNTEFAKISKEEQEKPRTEFQKSLASFSNLLMKIVIFLTIGIFFINALKKGEIIDSLLFALAIAIGLTPELLPAIITLSLSKGAHKMAQKDVLVKRLISIEDFGNMDVLCTDKTGTLTQGHLSVNDHFTYSGKTSDEVLLYASLCNSAVIHGNKIIGDPIDKAIFLHSGQLTKEKERTYEKIDELPFDYERKRMSVLLRHDGKSLMVTKGAPHSVIGISESINIDGKVKKIGAYKEELIERFKKLSSQGYRVIAVAYREIVRKSSYSIHDEEKLIFLGFVTFIDPPKKDAKGSIDKLESLSIKFKILTGDNEILTKKIAKEVDIKIGDFLLGEDIDKMDDKQLEGAVEKINAFCRLTPSHKLRIIKALRKKGHVVGYMGDGVNDVPALNESDVAISVYEAVDVAKEASDIILMKKSLDALADGVIEGRTIFNNTMKYVLMGTSSNFGNMFSVAGASIFLPFLPMLSYQILLVNLMYDFSELSIPTDNVDAEELKKPKKLKVGLIKRFMLVFGPISSLYDFITYGVMLFVFKASEELFRTGWFIESMMTELLVIFIIRTKRTPFYKSKPGKLLVLSTFLMAAIVLIIPFSPVASLLGFQRPPLLYFIILIGMVTTYLLLVEATKKWFFKKYDMYS